MVQKFLWVWRQCLDSQNDNDWHPVNTNGYVTSTKEQWVPLWCSGGKSKWSICTEEMDTQSWWTACEIHVENMDFVFMLVKFFFIIWIVFCLFAFVFLSCITLIPQSQYNSCPETKNMTFDFRNILGAGSVTKCKRWQNSIFHFVQFIYHIFWITYESLYL